MKKRTTVMFSALLTILMLLLAACGGESGPAGSTSGPVTLTVWGMGTEGDSLKVLADDFMKQNPNIQVKVQAIPWSDAHNKLLTSIAGNQTPDIAQMGTTWMAEFAKTGALDTTPGDFKPATFFKGAWDTTVWNGTSYGVPWYVETRVLFYRTDMAEKAGITQPPKTWDELMTMAKAMQQKGGAKYGLNLAPKNWQELIPFVWQAGGQVVKDGKFTLDTPQMVEALSYEQSFFKEKLTPGSQPPNYDVAQEFVQGRVAMFISGPWSAGLVEQQGKDAIKGKWAIAPMPTKVTNTSFVGGSDLVVFKNSQHRDAAWKFVSYLSNPQTQLKWYDTVKDLPAVQEAWNSPTLANDKLLAVFRTQLNNTQGPPTIPTWEQVANAIDTAMEKVMIGKATPQQAAQEMQQKATAIGTGS